MNMTQVFHYYRLELLVLDKGLPYTNVEPRDNENAGYDCYCADALDIVVGVPTLLSLGTKARMVRVNLITGQEDDVHYWLAPRSSIFKKGLIMANSMGVIDKSYRGELKAPVIQQVALHTEYAAKFPDWGKVARGERLFQIIAPDMGWIREVRIVDSLPESVRSEGGFGSSGRS